MNQDLSKFLMDTLSQSKDFVIEQSPDIVQQYVKMQVTDGIITVFTCTVIIVILFKLIKINFEDGFTDFMSKSVSGIGIFICVCTASDNISKTIRATFYPKGFLMDKILSDKAK